MGFNISGIAISKNYKGDFESLKQQYGWNLEGPQEISFEKASENYTEDDICNVYFTENGTLIFVAMERCIDGLPLEDANTMTFVLSEMSMTFVLAYFEGMHSKRTIFENEGNRTEDVGEPLTVEGDTGDASEIIWNQMEVLLGKSFHEIDLGAKAYQYRFASNKKKMPPPPPPRPVPTPVKPWWQFWK